MCNVLYIHGMGGGGDSRIPSILREYFAMQSEGTPVNMVTRTYDFDPDIAAVQIASWVEEVKPAVVVGESLGSLHALRIRDIPCVLVSPALNAPLYFEILAWLTLIPGVTCIFDRIYRPREGDRQQLHFTFPLLRRYRKHRRLALKRKCMETPVSESLHAFFGMYDHYRKSGIVSVRTWKKHFGDSFTQYEGTHFMEEEFVRSLLVPEIVKLLNIKK